MDPEGNYKNYRKEEAWEGKRKGIRKYTMKRQESVLRKGGGWKGLRKRDGEEGRKVEGKKEKGERQRKTSWG